MNSDLTGRALAREHRRLRVLLAPSAYYPHVGGIEELTRQLTLALRARGHEVAVLTNRWPGGIARSETLDGIHVTRLSFPLPAKHPASVARFLITSVPAARELLRYVRSWRPDVVHVVGAGPQSVYLAWLRGRIPGRLVFTAAGELTFDAHRVFERSAVLRWGLRRMLREADAVTACSAHVLRDLAAFGTIRSPSSVVPNGVDPREFEAATAEDSQRPYVLAVGRLVPQKGFDVLVEAFASDALRHFDLRIAGEGFERERLESRAAELGLGRRLHLLGTVDRARLARLLRGASVFAFPSRGEAFGIALLEAMAAGVPAIAASSGGVPELARDEWNALLVPPDDADALAVAIARVAADERLRRGLVEGGRRTAADLAWPLIASRYGELYTGNGGG